MVGRAWVLVVVQGCTQGRGAGASCAAAAAAASCDGGLLPNGACHDSFDPHTFSLSSLPPGKWYSWDADKKEFEEWAAGEGGAPPAQ